MQQPPGFKAAAGQPAYVWRLNKALYGLKQAGKSWNVLVHDLLASLGFTRADSDPCLYTHTDGTVILLYVDEIAMATFSETTGDY